MEEGSEAATRWTSHEEYSAGTAACSKSQARSLCVVFLLQPQYTAQHRYQRILFERRGGRRRYCCCQGQRRRWRCAQFPSVIPAIAAAMDDPVVRAGAAIYAHGLTRYCRREREREKRAMGKRRGRWLFLFLSLSLSFSRFSLFMLFRESIAHLWVEDRVEAYYCCVPRSPLAV